MTPAVQAPSATRLVDAWDAGLDQHPIDRALTVLGAWTGWSRDQLADLSLGTRDAALCQVRQTLGGEQVDGVCACVACGRLSEFSLSLGDLPPPVSPPEGGIVVAGPRGGVRVRLPTSRDLPILLSHEEADAQRALAERCLLAPAELDDDLIARIDAAMERFEGPAGVEVAFACAECGAANAAPLDVAGFTWEAVVARAERLVEEVDTLASAYGWSEDEILALSDGRRALYCRRVRG